VATGEDVRALKVLVQEKQVPAANVRIILCDTACSGGSITAGRLEDLAEAEPAQDAAVEAEVARLEALPPAERWEYWKRQFEKCVRCYACRAACPMCYCEECIAEKNLPQWIEVAARARGNFAWNVIRAWHLAGRCVLCGACERACPEGIRLMVLNRMLADEVKEAFGYVAGAGGAEEAAVFASWKEQDKDDFIVAD
jgi:ferredoxin